MDATNNGLIKGISGAARYLGVGRSVIYNAIEVGRLNPIRMGKKLYLFRVEELLQSEGNTKSKG